MLTVGDLLQLPAILELLMFHTASLGNGKFLLMVKDWIIYRETSNSMNLQKSSDDPEFAPLLNRLRVARNANELDTRDKSRFKH